MSLLFITFIPFAYIMLRAILPHAKSLRCRLALGGVLAAAAFQLPTMLFLAEPPLLDPELPGWLLILAAWEFAAVWIFFVLLLAADAVRLVVVKLGASARRFDGVIPVVLVTAASIISAIGMVNGKSVPEVHRYTHVDRKLPRELDGFTIALLADLHIGKSSDRRDIEEIVRRTNALHPDVIVIAGDLVSGNVRKVGDKADPLAELRAKYGVFAVTGNHDYYSGWSEWRKRFASFGIKMLENDRRLLPGKLVIAGITDPDARWFGEPSPDLDAALRDIPPDHFKLLVSHQVKLVREARAHGVNLQFSGHTHGGIILGLDRLVAYKNDGFVAGWYRVGDMALYVCRGTSQRKNFPLRLGVPSEIVLITLSRGETGNI